MKKLFYLLMLALPCFMLSACGDDDVTTDVPEDEPEDVPEVVKPVDQTSDGCWFDGILYYRKTSDGSQSREVMVTECKQEAVIVEIPSFVEYDGIKYSVTRIGEKSFEECDDLRSVTIPNSVRIIEKEAFCECHLTSVTIPNSVTTIEEMAFCDCQGLTSITIPSSVTSIGYDAFSSCTGLASIKVESGNKKYDSRGNCNAIIETVSNTLITGCRVTAIPNSVTSIGDSAFENCNSLKSINIPNSVTSIGDCAFENCDSLKSINIPNSVTSIGSYAFWGCSGLTSVTIPNSVTSIGSYAFYWCNGLTSVTIGNSVKSIGDYAFDNCRLTDVTCLAKIPPTLDYQSFSGCDNLHILPGCKAAYEGSNWKSYFKDIVEDAKE